MRHGEQIRPERLSCNTTERLYLLEHRDVLGAQGKLASLIPPERTRPSLRAMLVFQRLEASPASSQSTAKSKAGVQRAGYLSSGIISDNTSAGWSSLSSLMRLTLNNVLSVKSGINLGNTPRNSTSSSESIANEQSYWWKPEEKQIIVENRSLSKWVLQKTLSFVVRLICMFSY